jgi:hypothetical protein
MVSVDSTREVALLKQEFPMLRVESRRMRGVE